MGDGKLRGRSVCEPGWGGGHAHYSCLIAASEGLALPAPAALPPNPTTPATLRFAQDQGMSQVAV